MGECYCIGYNKQFDKLDLKLFKDDRHLYEYIKISIWLKDLQEGYFVKRWNKPTKKGTNVAFEALQNNEQYLEKKKALEEYIGKINKELGINIYLAKEEESEDVQATEDN